MIDQTAANIDSYVNKHVDLNVNMISWLRWFTCNPLYAEIKGASNIEQKLHIYLNDLVYIAL